MLWKLLAAWGLMGTCVVIHASGIAFSLRRLRQMPPATLRFWLWVWLLFASRAGSCLCIWPNRDLALFYTWRGALPDLSSSVYFSAVTYTTTGYGDLVLPSEWRLVGAVEA